MHSQAHKEQVNTNPFYDEIDALIEEMDFNNKKKSKSKRRNKKKNKDETESEEEQKEARDELELLFGFNNMNLMSTEVTLVKEQHKRKNRVPMPLHQIHSIKETQKLTMEQQWLHQMHT